MNHRPSTGNRKQRIHLLRFRAPLHRRRCHVFSSSLSRRSEPPRRSFSDRSYIGARSHNASGGGDSPFRPVGEAHLGLRHGESGSFGNNSGFHRSSPMPERPPQFNQNPRFRPPPPHFHQNQQFRPWRPQFRRPLPFEQNEPQRPSQQSRPRPPDYQNWEYAQSALPSTSERFTILSYNLIADYVALGYRHRMELFSHIPRHMLDWQWRKSKIMFELGLWSTDIMCFQISGLGGGVTTSGIQRHLEETDWKSS